MAWPLGGTPPRMNPENVKRLKFPKAPADLTPVTLDFGGPLSAIEDDYLVSVTNALSVRNDDQPSDLTLVPPYSIDSATYARITVWCAAGSAGYEYLVSVTGRSNGGQTIERSFILPVGLR